MNEMAIAAAAGFLAGAMNAAAGGGSFVTVPVLIWEGIPSVAANMSSTIALYPGSIASAWVFRKTLRTVLEISLWALFLTTLSGDLRERCCCCLLPARHSTASCLGFWRQGHWHLRLHRLSARDCSGTSGRKRSSCCWCSRFWECTAAISEAPWES